MYPTVCVTAEKWNHATSVSGGSVTGEPLVFSPPLELAMILADTAHPTV